MAFEKFIDIRFQRKTLEMIHLVNSIVEELWADGYNLTLRQLFYQLVQQGVIPNKQREYKKLGETISNARKAGLVDWEAIEDRTRSLRGVSHRESPEEIIKDAAGAFRIDKWRNQKFRPEVWVEKDALVGVLQKACEPLDVDYFSCRGNTSQTAMYNTAQRFRRYFDEGQTPCIIHLGDHDPSGIDMTRDIFDRLEMFVTSVTGEEIEVDRIALNMNQVRQYNPPPNPAKQTDSRYKAYARKFGTKSWELDALNVRVLDALITKAILARRDDEQWEKDVEIETKHRDQLGECASKWIDVADYVDNPTRFAKMTDEPEEMRGDAKSLKARLHRIFCKGDALKPAEEITIFTEHGNAVSMPNEQFASILMPKKSTSIKSKSNKSKPKK